jgi:hypothetical protein
MMFQKSQARVISILNSSKEFTAAERKQKLKAVNIELNSLEDATNKWVQKEVNRNYRGGMNQAKEFDPFVKISGKSSG